MARKNIAMPRNRLTKPAIADLALANAHWQRQEGFFERSARNACLRRQLLVSQKPA
jgi:hypothetical protein